MKKTAVDHVLRRLTKEVSSFTVVDVQDLQNSNLFVKLQNIVKTRVVLNQTEGMFSDFNRREFDKISIAIYEAARDAAIHNDKITLMNVLSYPLNDMISSTMNLKVKLPFRFYDHILGSKIAHARIFSHHLHNMNSFVTWHQIATKFRVELDGQPKEQLVVFERRESDAEQYAWRICHLTF